ncbi:MAG: hypothetical protein WBY53_05760 [Acidobacteriaceae bacterium]
MNAQRWRVVVMAVGVAAMGALLGVTVPQHSWRMWVGLGLEVVLLARVIVLLLQLNRDERRG